VVDVSLFLPGAVWRPISYRQDAGKFAPGQPLGYIPHVPVCNGSLFHFFNGLVSPNRKFSTAWVAKDGSSEQYTELINKPWAQATGNPYYHAFEVEGYPNEPYTAAQINTLAVWHNFLGTPDTLANTPMVSGIGTHYMGGAAWGGHTCPDPVAGAGPRSKQRAAIIERAITLRTPKGIFMALTDAQQADLLADVAAIKDRLFGIYPQRFMTVADGVATSVSATTAGAVPARGLDQLDGNVLLRTQPDPGLIAKAVLAILPAGGAGATAAQIAKAVNDDAAKRLVA